VTYLKILKMLIPYEFLKLGFENRMLYVAFSKPAMVMKGSKNIKKIIAMKKQYFKVFFNLYFFNK
jgi:hypothetical protein